MLHQVAAHPEWTPQIFGSEIPSDLRPTIAKGGLS